MNDSLLENDFVLSDDERYLENNPSDGSPPDGSASDNPPSGDRPEWLPEKYATPEDLAKAYGELETKLGKKEDDLRESLTKELEDKRLEGRPETAGDYQLPESMDESQALDSNLLKWWADEAHKNGYSQERFEEGIELYRKALPEPEVQDLDAERAILGESANERIKAASLFAEKEFGEEHGEEIKRLFETAGGVKVMEAMMKKMKSGGIGSDTPPVPELTEAQLTEMMGDERYWKDKDPAFIQKVTDGFSKLYNG